MAGQGFGQVGNLHNVSRVLYSKWAAQRPLLRLRPKQATGASTLRPQPPTAATVAAARTVCDSICGWPRRKRSGRRVVPDISASTFIATIS